MPSCCIWSAICSTDHGAQGPHMSDDKFSNDSANSRVLSALLRISFASSSVKATAMVCPGLAFFVCFVRARQHHGHSPLGIALHGFGGLAYAHLLSGGLPAYVQQTGFATRGPTTSVPYVDTTVGPKIPPKNLDERILRVPNVMRMGAQHMQPSPFGVMCLLKAQCIPSQPSPHEVA